MEKHEASKRIGRILADNNYSWGALTARKQKLLLDVYQLISDKVTRLNKLNTEITQNKFSKQSLADELHISRKTLGHNNPEISIVIDHLIENNKHLWHTEDDELRFKIKVLEERLQAFYERDAETIDYKIKMKGQEDEICALRAQVKSKNTEIERLKKKLDNQELTALSNLGKHS